ncbi:MAG: InlB B-repeat-containing protein [Spirochaetia bacterium]|jgi:uncharacterized repeat protein (TIGR02543 family)|nr:InlB B-repeat-containing protein [Spirochaetales bacterium]MDX9784335.1 InlB B-repeat-containing protein [Spirochaetia bacterium]
MKNQIRISLSCILFFLLFLGGCDLTTPAVYEIRYHSNDGSDTVVVQSVQSGQSVLLQANPFTREGYSFAGWMATEPDGTQLDFADKQELLMANIHLDLYASWESEAESGLLQSYGPSYPGSAGGLVFYDKRYYSDGWRYLEMAPASTEWTAEWGASGYLVKGENEVSLKFPPWAQEDSVYGGALNTQQIVQYHNELGNDYPDRGDYYSNPDKYPTGYVINNIKVVSDGSVAAKTCLDFIYNGCDDWYLPSFKELCLFISMYGSSKTASLKPEGYWSSTQYGPDGALSYNSADVNTFRSFKFENLRVRAMRAF